MIFLKHSLPIYVFSVLMAIVANDFTLGYFNFTYGFPTFIASDISQSEVQLQSSVISIDDEFTKEIITNEWNTTNPTASWD